jgi:hypothetical protein
MTVFKNKHRTFTNVLFAWNICLHWNICKIFKKNIFILPQVHLERLSTPILKCNYQLPYKMTDVNHTWKSKVKYISHQDLELYLQFHAGNWVEIMFHTYIKSVIEEKKECNCMCNLIPQKLNLNLKVQFIIFSIPVDILFSGLQKKTSLIFWKRLQCTWKIEN